MLAAGVAAAQAQQQKRPGEWKPKLGVLGPYTPNNVKFAHQEGFNNMILGVGRGTLDPESATDQQIAETLAVLKSNEMNVSAFQVTQNHIAADPAQRKRENDHFVKAIELAGKMGVPYIGTCSGKDANKKFPAQVDDIVRTYTERYFPACQKNKVRILWENWPEGPNIATSPVGFAALFKGFGDCPYVGLQYDPSHFVRQFMDPIEPAREFSDKIFDVHLKDTEIRWDVLKRGGINPVDGANWWLYRIPGCGSINWSEFFTVLQHMGYQGAMSVEHEDPLYGAPNQGGADFTPEYGMGFRMARRYLSQYVPV
jgi:sugar phosphate isomerase/epimerase